MINNVALLELRIVIRKKYIFNFPYFIAIDTVI